MLLFLEKLLQKVVLFNSSYNDDGFIIYTNYNGIAYNYTYDAMGRLASETINNYTTYYNYDVAPNGTNMGNNALTSVTGDNTNVTYLYDAYGKVLSITNNNVSSYFRYDDMGNPVLYKGSSSTATNNLVWTQGRKLESGTLNDNTFAYAYDMTGMRYQKTVNGNVTEYYLDGTSIIAENRKVGETNNLIYYIYDMNGLSGMVYNGENYYYVKNTLGDIIAIRNSAGTEVASYNYDAWGNVINKYGTMADINPFRYRGYYYDVETGFYYLQTRYYDPTTRLFINADNYELLATLAETPGQLNMYAYCNNNPIMFTDESGEVVLTLGVAFLFGALFSAGGSIVSQLSTTGTIEWGKVGLSALFGGIGGMLAVTGFGNVAGQFFLQGAISAAETLVETTVYNSWEDFSIDGLIFDFIVSGTLGTIGAKAAGKDFYRKVQIEKSLLKSLKRGFNKNGIKGLIKTWGQKSGKFMKCGKEIVRNALEGEVVGMIIGGVCGGLF